VGRGILERRGYFVASVGRYTRENVIAEYVKNQGKKKDDYKPLYLTLERE
jgi:REP element-mobilizing transposase RayT